MKIFGSISELVDLAFRLAGGRQIRIRSNPQSAPAGQTITVSVPDVAGTGDAQNMVLTLATQTIENKTLTSPTVNTPAITGGSINSTPIGQTTRAAGSFTTVNTNGTATVQTLTVPSLSTAGILHSTPSTGVITSSKLVNADVDDAAAIAFSKLAILPSAQLLIGSSLDVATPQAISGDISVNNGGVAAIASEVIVDDDISPSAAIDRSKLAAGNSYRIVSNNNEGAMTQNESLVVEKALVSTPTADLAVKGPVTTSSTTAAQIALLDDLDALKGKVQNQIDNKQGSSAVLSTIADDITPAADKYIYFTGVDDAVAGTITSFGRSLVDDADSTAARSTLGLGSMATQAASIVAVTGGTISNVDLNDTTSNRLRSEFASAAISSGTLDATKGLMRLLVGGTTLNSITDSTGKLGLSGVNLTLNNYSVGADVIVTNAGNIITGTGEDFVLKQGAAASFVHNGDGKFVLTGGAGSAAGGLTTSPLAATLNPAVKNTHYLTNTSGGAFSVTLPAGAAGSVIRFSDANETWDANALTIIPATGEKIDGLATNESLVCDVKRGWVELSWNTALSSWSIQSLSATNVVEASATQAGVVSTGAQTFAGVKTFQDAPVISSATGIVAASATVPGVVSTGTQTFAGEKTFSNRIVMRDAPYTATGQLSVLNNTATIIMSSFPATGSYLISAKTIVNTFGQITAIVYRNGAGTLTITALTSFGMSFTSTSADQLFVTQTIGSTLDVKWTALLIN